MKLQRLVALALVGTVVVGGISVAEGAKKKRRKVVKWVPAPVDLFMRQTGTACSESHEALMLEPSAGSDIECWPVDNFLQEVAGPAVGYLSTDWPAEAGVPFVLDATKPAAGTITVQSYQGAGGGLAELDIALIGETGGEERTLGTWTTSYQAVPNAKNTFDYEIDVDDALNKASFDTLVLRTTARGAAINHGIFELDDPASFVSIPTLTKKVIRK